MMQFIILGYLPGTNIQINFGFLAQVCAVLTVFYLIHLILKEEKFLKQQKVDAIETVSL